MAAPVVEVTGKYLSPCNLKVQLRKLHLKSWWIGVCSLHNSLTQPIKTATKRHASSLITLFYGKITALSKKNLNYSLQNSYRQLLGFLGPFRCHKTVFSAILLCFSTFLLFKSLQISLNLNPPPPTNTSAAYFCCAFTKIFFHCSRQIKAYFLRALKVQWKSSERRVSFYFLLICMLVVRRRSVEKRGQVLFTILHTPERRRNST